MARKKRNTSVDWEAAKLLYIAGKPDPVTGFSANYSYVEIGKIFHIARSAVSMRGRKEGWPGFRKQYKEKRESDALDILREAGITDIARVQATNVAAAMGAMSRYMKTLPEKNISTFEAHIMMKYLDGFIKDATEEPDPDKPTAGQIANTTLGDLTRMMLQQAREEGDL